MGSQVSAALTAISSETVRGSTVAIEGNAVLIEGPSGAGKSDLALRLIDRGAILVSDDYTAVVRDGERLIAKPASNIAGKIEVRGIGIIDMPYAESAELKLVVRLIEAPDRLPVDHPARWIAGITLPEVQLSGLEPSAAIKAELALKRILDAGK